MPDDELVSAICQSLATAGVGVWRPTGPAYTSAEVGIFYGPIGASPDRAIGVTLYAADEDGAPGDQIQWRRVQVRVRGGRAAPSGADALASAVHAALSRVSRVHGISYIKRVLVAPLGVDGNGRTERADSYSLTLDSEA